jgi:hypothetical protein
MPDLVILGADLVAIIILTYGLYYRRHRRKDMLLAYVGLNVGVLAVASVLASVAIATGVGLGLFGVLSIIRLRSSEISHEEVAYYFASLALGLIAGLQPTPAALAPALSAMILVAMYVADHPRVLGRLRRQVITLDAVYVDERALESRLQAMLGGEVLRTIIIQTDLVRDQTTVDVRYRLPATPVQLGGVDHASRPTARNAEPGVARVDGWHPTAAAPTR